MRHTVRYVVCLATLLALVPLVSFAQTTTFNLPAQPLAESLKALGAQAKVNVMVSTALVDGKQAPALKAKLSVGDALARLLNGTGLEYHFVNDQTIVIREKGAAAVAVKDPPTGQVTNTDGQDSAREAGKKPSQDFRVAQVGQGQTSSPSTVEKQDEMSSEKTKEEQLQVVVVTGSRLRLAPGQRAEDVKVYPREVIESSGQSSLTDFLNTLPEVSVSNGESGYQGYLGATTVQLRGLPVGTTLVLINGRRVEDSGQSYFATGTGAFFDLNNLPLAAVDRIEVIPEGSSAIYGSDAIGGVVNIILKKNFQGAEADLRYGDASHSSLQDTTASVALGNSWEHGALSIVGSFQDRGQLLGEDRTLTRSQNFTAYGGPDSRQMQCNPGNISTLDGSNLPGLSASFAAIPPSIIGKPTVSQFVATAGTENECSTTPLTSLIPATRRAAFFASGTWRPEETVEVFSELLYSHIQATSYFGEQGLYSQPVPASNPYNPFGETVAVNYAFNALPLDGDDQTSIFYKVLVGTRGTIGPQWDWELALSQARDRDDFNITNLNATNVAAALASVNPNTSLNVFTSASPASPAVLQSLIGYLPYDFAGQTRDLNAFVRGRLLQLPAGPVEVVLGGELERDQLYYSTAFNGVGTLERNSSAVFAESRVPLLGSGEESSAGDTLALTAAVRFDDYSDFGSKFTPQAAIEWHPVEELVLRGGYSQSFRAPTIYALNESQFSAPIQFCCDPERGNQAISATTLYGGNPHLKAETGTSISAAAIWKSTKVQGLTVSLTGWRVTEDDRIQAPIPQLLVANESLFSDLIIRAPPTSADIKKGWAGQIVEINDTFLNFGELQVAGIDIAVNYKWRTAFGDWTPSLSATQTVRYLAALIPGAAPTQRLSEANLDGFAPRLKGTVGLAWAKGPFTTSVSGHYISRYLDYQDVPNSNYLGNFWTWDIHGRYELGELLGEGSGHWRKSYVEAGAVNVTNVQPRYSNFEFAFLGYDPAQYDIRGRFLYVGAGLRF